MSISYGIYIYYTFIGKNNMENKSKRSMIKSYLN